MRHQAILVTSLFSEKAQAAHAQAKIIFSSGQITDIQTSVINDYFTFFIGPDGSKEGWPDSERGDEQRRLFRGWLNVQCYEDD